MKFADLVFLFLWPRAIHAYNLFKHSTSSTKHQMALSLPDNIPDIDLTTLLASTPRNSEVFTKAMISLQNLQGESFCHRLAVQLLMNNCKGIKEVNDKGLPLLHDAHKIQVEAFITGLTLCVLARGEFLISDSCAPFTASALLQAHQQGDQKLDVSKEQNDACVASLSRDSSQWATWLSQQREALTICRAVRLDIEKDETIALHIELTRVMAEFAGGLELDLERLRQSMNEQAQVMESNFESVLNNMKVKLQSTLDTALTGLQDVSHSLKSNIGSIVDINQLIQILLKTVVQSNAELAAEQEVALVATANLAVTRMNGINLLAEDTSATLNHLKYAIDQLIPAIVSLSDRQDAIELKAQILSTALNNMTDLVTDHTESIEQATFAAKNLSSQMKDASAAAKSWNESFVPGVSIRRWLTDGTLGLFGVMIGSWGLPPSIMRNVVLFLGVPTAFEMSYQLHHWSSEWCLPLILVEWSFRGQTPSSLTQLAREKVDSPTTTALKVDSLDEAD